eukprot:2265335-Amphidinium_carterae.1
MRFRDDLFSTRSMVRHMLGPIFQRLFQGCLCILQHAEIFPARAPCFEALCGAQLLYGDLNQPSPTLDPCGGHLSAALSAGVETHECSQLVPSSLAA